MKLGIVTDSTSDIPQYLVEEYELEVIPSILIMDGKEYADGIGISREEFYRKLASLKMQPTTAAPSIGDFSARYESLLTRGCDHILSIHAAGALTSILNIARQAPMIFRIAPPVDSTPLVGTCLRDRVAEAAASCEMIAVTLSAVESARD
jgi:DegV family protein with EDD domain